MDIRFVPVEIMGGEHRQQICNSFIENELRPYSMQSAGSLERERPQGRCGLVKTRTGPRHYLGVHRGGLPSRSALTGLAAEA